MENWLKKKIEEFKDDFEFRLEYIILSITEKISKTMKKKNMSRSQLADRLNVSPPAVTKILNGSSNFTLKTLFAAGETIRVVKVWKGERDSADAVLTQPLKVLVPREGAGQVRVEVEYLEPLIAPVAEGQQIATMRVSLEGRDLAKVPLVARATVPEAGMVGRLIDSIRLWLK